jgi:hypothetical protein
LPLFRSTGRDVQNCSGFARWYGFFPYRVPAPPPNAYTISVHLSHTALCLADIGVEREFILLIFLLFSGIILAAAAISVADPIRDPVPFLTPGCGIRKRFFTDLESRIPNPCF